MTHVDGEVLRSAVYVSGGRDGGGDVLHGNVGDVDRVRQSYSHGALGPTERPTLTRLHQLALWRAEKGKSRGKQDRGVSG